MTWLDVYIDQNGNLKSVSLNNGFKAKTDMIFGLVMEYGPEEIRPPSTEFEKDAIAFGEQSQKMGNQAAQ